MAWRNSRSCAAARYKPTSPSALPVPRCLPAPTLVCVPLAGDIAPSVSRPVLVDNTASLYRSPVASLPPSLPPPTLVCVPLAGDIAPSVSRPVLVDNTAFRSRARSSLHEMDAPPPTPLPRVLEVSEYAAARLREIIELHGAVATPRARLGGARSGTRTVRNRRAFQLLPWHARRRSMSFSARRVPRRYRQAAAAELERQAAALTVPSRPHRAVAKQRRRTRRYYRRSGWLLEARARKAAERGWLETHVWHAKRMHMVRPAWGGVIALEPCDRGVRSFWRCVAHTRGPMTREDGSYACALYDASWQRVVEVHATTDNMEALERVLSAETTRQLQTAAVARGRKRLTGVCIRDADARVLAAQVEVLCPPRPPRDTLWLLVHPASVQAVLDAFTAVPSGTLGDNVRERPRAYPLADGCVRLELYGARSTQVLYRVLRNARAHGPGWAALEAAAVQGISADSVAANTMLEVCCEDPRGHYPPRAQRPSASGRADAVDANYAQFMRSESDEEEEEEEDGEEGAVAVDDPGYHPACPSLFDATARAAVRQPIAERLLNERRRARWRRAAVTQRVHQVPQGANAMAGVRPRPSDSDTDANTAVQRVPLLLVQRPATSVRRIDCGWDVLLPCGWAMAFWTSLVYAGARAVGLRERRFLYHEAGRSHFPEDYIDCPVAYGPYAEQQVAAAQASWSRRPPGKRVNAVQLRVPQPFGVVDWACGHWGTAEGQQREGMGGSDEPAAAASPVTVRVIRSAADRQAYEQAVRMSHPTRHGHWRWFTRVQVIPLGKSRLAAPALICAPLSTDMHVFAGRRHESEGEDDGHSPQPLVETPGRPGDAMPTRPLIGRVTNSAFSLSGGGVRAFGYVRTDAMRPGNTQQVLVRNVTCRRYRPARIVTHDEPE